MKLFAQGRCAGFVMFLLSVSVAFGQEAGRSAVTFEQRIPDTVTAVIRIPSVTDLSARLSDCSLGQLARDESLSEVRATIVDRLRTDLTNSRLWPQGTTLDDWSKLATGEVGLAVLPASDGPTPIILMMKFDQEPGSVDQLLDRISTASVGAGWSRSPVPELSGLSDKQISAVRFSRKPARPRPGQRELEMLLVRHDSHLIVSNSLAAIHDVLRRWTGAPAGAFSGNETWRTIRAKVSPDNRDPGVLWFVDPASLTGGGAGNPVLGTLEGFGLSGIKGVGGGFDFSTPRFDTSSHVVAVFGEPPSGPLRLAANSLRIPHWAPSSASTTLALNLDLRATWTALSSAAESSPAGSPIGSIVASLNSFAERLKLNLADDVMPQFVGPITVLQKPLPRTDMKVPPRNGIVIGAEILDVEKAQQLLDRIASVPESPLKRRTSGGTVVFKAGSAGGGLVEIAIAHGSLLIANSSQFMDEVVATDVGIPRLLADPEFERLQTAAPADVALIGVQQTSEQFQLLHGLLQLSLPTLPPFGQVKHHFRPSTTWLRTSDGVVEYVNVTLPLMAP